MKRSRLNLRLDDSLTEEIKAYATRQGTTVTSIIRNHFIRLLEEEKRARVLDAEQI